VVPSRAGLDKPGSRQTVAQHVLLQALRLTSLAAVNLLYIISYYRP
jgi:hypothetical protein